MKKIIRYKKVLLLNGSYEDTYFDLQPEIPPGLGYLAEALKEKGIEYDIIDMDLKYQSKNLFPKIRSFQPELIGISLMSIGYKKNYELIKNIKRNFPSIDIVVGGPHISTIKKEVMEECKEIDFGILREGELTIIELCMGKNIEEIKGLMYRKNGEIIYNGDRKFVDHLDSLKFPTYEKFDLEGYKKISRHKILNIPLITSRGCPFSCTYCGAYLSLGKKFRFRSPVNVVDEIEYWHKKGMKNFRIFDDNFTLIKDRVYKICREIKKRKLTDLRISCDNGVRADRVDKDLLRAMKEVGFYRLDFGVEGGNNKILKILKKGEKIETIDKAIKDACETGFEVQLTFLIGSPEETWKDFQDGIDLALRYPISSSVWYHILPYPETELFQWLKDRNLLLEKPSDYLNSASRRRNQPLFVTPSMSLKERKKAWKYSRKIMRKITVKSTKRKLKKLGFLGNIMAQAYGSFFLRNLLIGNNIVRKLIISPVKKIANL